MNFKFTNAHIYNSGSFISQDFSLNGISVPQGAIADTNFIFNDEVFVFPAFCDVHVHLREPGFFYKETIKSGTSAAARGGYSDVFSMPNLNPVPDNAENLQLQLDIIEKDAVINVHPFGSITVEQQGERLADLDAMAEKCGGFSDDGRGVQDRELMKAAMLKAKELGKIIVAHCEDNSLLEGGYIHKGEYANAHGHRGICSESEWKPIERDIELIRETGCRYHVCHISTKESVELIRKAKAEGLPITCETGPHYLVLDDSFLQEDARFKMNPPLRSPEDRIALIEGLKDGTIDCIATDHAPHSAEEKGRGLEKSLMGVVGLETAYPVLYTNLVQSGVITLEKLIEVMSINPRKIFGLPLKEDCCIFDLKKAYTINPEDFLSMGKSSPFTGDQVFGENLLTIVNGKAVWNKLSK